MKTSDAISHFGSVIKLALALDINRSAVYQWIDKGEIPKGRQYEIQILTGGALKANGSSVVRRRATEQRTAN